MLQYLRTLIFIFNIANCGIPTQGSSSLRSSISRTAQIRADKSNTPKCDDSDNGALQESVLSAVSTLAITDAPSSDTINKSEEDSAVIRSTQRPINISEFFAGLTPNLSLLSNNRDTEVEIKDQVNMDPESNTIAEYLESLFPEKGFPTGDSDSDTADSDIAGCFSPLDQAYGAVINTGDTEVEIKDQVNMDQERNKFHHYMKSLFPEDGLLTDDSDTADFFKTLVQELGVRINTGDTEVEIKDRENMNQEWNTIDQYLESFVVKRGMINGFTSFFVKPIIRLVRKGLLLGIYGQKFIYQHFVERSQSTDDEMIKSSEELMKEFVATYEKFSKDDWSVFKGTPSKEIMDMIELNDKQLKAIDKFSLEHFASLVEEDGGTVDSAQFNDELSKKKKRFSEFLTSLTKYFAPKFAELFGFSFSGVLGRFLDDKENDHEKQFAQMKPLLTLGVKMFKDLMEKKEEKETESSKDFDIATKIFE